MSQRNPADSAVATPPAPTSGSTTATAERIVGLVLFGFAVLVYFAARDYSMGRWAAPGPGSVPTLLSVLLGLMSIGLVLRPDGGRKGRPDGPLVTRKSLACVGLLLGYPLGIAGLGYLLATVAFMLIAGVVFGLDWRSRWMLAVLIALGVAIGSWALFVGVFGVPLPDGLVLESMGISLR